MKISHDLVNSLDPTAVFLSLSTDSTLFKVRTSVIS
jgi:hypothetical protein